jgi:sulfoxide reductase catalytic subunit YedY
MPKIPSSEITARRVYLNRRAFMRNILVAGGATVIADTVSAQPVARHGRKLTTVRSALSTTEKPNTWEQVTTYNNFYEFGTAKSDPAFYAPKFRPHQPWTVTIEGECAKPGRLHLDDILKGETLEDRIYRHRCVEGWSMVIPWVGFPLANLIKRVQPTAKAKFVEFTTIYDTNQMLGLRDEVLDWPYEEGLRMDEAMHPLTILSVGIYGEMLPNQNGAPLRAGDSVEVRFQGRKVDCQHPLRREAAGDILDEELARGVRLLFKRESHRRPPAPQPGHRSAAAVVLQFHADAAVQWLW